jgi:ApeA N-terminal domain 1
VELPGNLDVRPNRPPQGSIYGSVPLQIEKVDSGGYAASFPQVIEVPVLSGVLANGGSVVLLDASLSYTSMRDGRLSGSAALLGKGRAFNVIPPLAAPDYEVDDQPLISSASFQLTGLDAVLGSAPISHVVTPGLSPNNPKNQWSAYLNLEATGEWEVEGITLSVGYDGRMRAMDGYEFKIEFSPVATLNLSQAMSLRAIFDDFIEPLRRIASIAIGGPQELAHVAVELKGHRGEYQVFGTGITQSPFKSSSRKLRTARSALRAMPDNTSLLEIILKWRQCASEHHPLIETYGAMLHAGDQHPRSRFLLLIQALEGLYGYETKEKYNERKSAHIAKREKVIEQGKNHLDEESIKFLKRFLLKNPPTSLESTLRAMVSGLPGNIMDRLAATSLVREAMSDPAAPTTPADALRVVRNNLAHGNRGYDVQMLDEAVRILEFIVRAHSLRILGCPDHVVERVFDES